MEKYEKALELARNYYPDNLFLDTIFHELAESEDERIRKEIIDYFHRCSKRNSKSGFRLEQYKSWIAYLEKQKEQQPAEWSEEDEKNAFCKENCKGFQETGKCFADGECEAKREADKRSDKVLTNDEVKTIIDIYDKHCCECGFGLWDRMKHKDAIAKEVCKRFNNFGKNSK